MFGMGMAVSTGLDAARVSAGREPRLYLHGARLASATESAGRVTARSHEVSASPPASPAGGELPLSFELEQPAPCRATAPKHVNTTNLRMNASRCHGL